MDILLDTCSALWFLIGDEKMSMSARDIICDAENKVYVSIASVWEVAIKISINKLDFDSGINGFINAIEDNGFLLLIIDTNDTKAVANLPFVHRDPFDRMLIAQAITHNMTIMTTDTEIVKYNVSYI